MQCNVSNISSILTKWSFSSSQSQTRQVIIVLYSLTTVQDLERDLIICTKHELQCMPLLLVNHRHILVLLAAGREHLCLCDHYHNHYVSRSPRSQSAPCWCWAPGRCPLPPLSVSPFRVMLRRSILSGCPLW